MNDSDTPRRRPEYVLERIDDDYQLRHRGRGTAIYLNETAALLWELCDGKKSIGDIKRMLQAAYPDAAEIELDVDEAMSMLLGHHVLNVAQPPSL